MKILLVDDDPELIGVLHYSFQHDGYRVVTASDGKMGLRMFESEVPDLVVLDLIMPHKDGLAVLQGIRQCGDVPVIVLTALSDEEHVVTALELGADDYLVKPFRMRELKARAHALLRRNRHQTDLPLKSPIISIGGVTLDPSEHQVFVANQPIHLTPTEFGLLHYLMLNHDIIIRVPDIIAAVWGYDSDVNDDVVKVTVSRLRRRLEVDSCQPQPIVNVPGVGYKFQSRGR